MQPNAEGPFLLICGVVAAALVWRAHRRNSRGGSRASASHGSEFAPMVGGVVDAMTQAALDRHRWLPLRHAIVRDGVDPKKLEAAFDDISAAFAPQQVDYSNTAYSKNHWNLSCFMQYTNGVAAGGINLAAGAPMLKVCDSILADCDACFLKWYDELHPRAKDATRTLVRMQSFVTRYLPTPDESHLPRHIDGANVDGSLVLGLPTYREFGDSGGLTVWDGEDDSEVFKYPVASGEVCLLDSRVWHQSNPITRGERWVIVIFYEVKTERPNGGRVLVAKPNGTTATTDGGSKVRQLLARRIKDAAKRKTQTEASAAVDVAAWQSEENKLGREGN